MPNPPPSEAAVLRATSWRALYASPSLVFKSGGYAEFSASEPVSGSEVRVRALKTFTQHIV